MRLRMVIHLVNRHFLSVISGHAMCSVMLCDSDSPRPCPQMVIAQGDQRFGDQGSLRDCGSPEKMPDSA